MMTKSIFVVLLLTAAVFCYQEQGNVLILHDADFPKVLEELDYVMIEFYAPWCGHCKKLNPIYTEVADELKAQGSEVRLAKVDATIDSVSAGTYKVQGYPTIFFFHKGEKIDYKGQRTKEYLVNWLLKKTRDPLVPLDQEAYEKLASDSKVAVVFHGDASSEQGKIVSKLAISDDYNTYYIASGVTGKTAGSVQVFRPFASVATYESADDKLQAWIRRNERPSVVPFDDRTIGDMFSGAKAGVCLFNSAGSSVLLASFSQSAEKYLDSGRQLIFTHIEKDTEHLGPFSEYIKIKPEQIAVVLIEGKIQSKFVLNKAPEDIDSEDITEFLESWNSGNAKKYGITDEVENAQAIEEQL